MKVNTKGEVHLYLYSKRNPTYLNEREITNQLQVTLKHNDTIRIKQTYIQIIEPKGRNNTKKEVKEWSKKEVSKWVSGVVGSKKYGNDFEDNEIDGQALLNLKEQDLDILVTDEGDRNVFIERLTKLMLSDDDVVVDDENQNTFISYYNSEINNENKNEILKDNIQENKNLKDEKNENENLKEKENKIGKIFKRKIIHEEEEEEVKNKKQKNEKEEEEKKEETPIIDKKEQYELIETNDEINNLNIINNKIINNLIKNEINMNNDYLNEILNNQNNIQENNIQENNINVKENNENNIQVEEENENKEKEEEENYKKALQYESKLCSICCLEKDYEYFGKLKCSHEFCKKCLKEYFQNMIDSEQLPILCPSIDCKKIIFENDLVKYVSSDYIDNYNDIIDEVIDDDDYIN
jgi:hypothetical protein